MVLGVSMDASRALPSSPGVLWGVFWEALGVSWVAFWVIFLAQGGIRSENDEMLENDDPYGTFAMFSTSRGLRNEAKMLPETQFSDVRVRTRAEGVSGSVVGASRELQDGVWDGRMAKK